MGCWNYIITKPSFDEIKGGTYLSSYANYDIKKGDLILIYIKSVGYVGYTKAITKYKINDHNKKIYRDINKNRFYMKVKKIKETVPVSINIAFKTFKHNKIGYKSTSSFCNKFLTGIFVYHKIDLDTGKSIKNNIKQFLVDEVNKTSNIKHEFTTEESLLINNDSDDDIDDFVIKRYYPFSEECDYGSEIEDFVGKIEKKERFNYIPSMIIPCNKLELPKLPEKMAEFLDHLRHCNKCEIVNNNNIEIFGMVDKSDMEFYELDVKKDKNDKKEFKHIINHYYENKPYKFTIDKIHKNKSVVKFIQINDDDIYDKCYSVLWSYYG